MEILPQVFLHALLVVNIELSLFLGQLQRPGQRDSTRNDGELVLLDLTEVRKWCEDGMCTYEIWLKGPGSGVLIEISQKDMDEECFL